LEAWLNTEESRRHFHYAYGIDDGVNPVQETSGATVLANILTGLEMDENPTRTDVAAGLPYLAKQHNERFQGPLIHRWIRGFVDTLASVH
jgi:hypothetical protein